MESKRLESLDILRGLDMFVLVVLSKLVSSFGATGEYPRLSGLFYQFEHADWVGFTSHDLIMPLFMFCAGAAIPFAFSKYRENGLNQGKMWARIIRRVILLWVFGMACQGDLLSYDWDKFSFFSNTLQSIAVGYFFSAIFFMYTKPRTQVGIAVLLLIAYWALMMFVSVDGYGGGDFSKDGNLAEWVDRAVLGSHRDCASIGEDGSVVFADYYRYTWILSSLTFIVTVMSGMFAGEILRSRKWDEKRKSLILVVAGIVMVAAGWIWGLQMPVIKKIWTSSMVLVASGYSFILLGVLYWLVDIRKAKWLDWLKVFGMNAIVAYLMAQLIDFKGIFRPFLCGLEQYIGAGWYHFILRVFCVAFSWWILSLLYKNKKFIRL